MSHKYWGCPDGASEPDPKLQYDRLAVEWYVERQGILRTPYHIIEPRKYNGYGDFKSVHPLDPIWEYLAALLADNIPVPGWWQRPFWYKTATRYELRLREHALIVKLNFQY